MAIDSLFLPLLNLHPAIGLLIISFLISLLVTIVYKYTTDQTLMKSLRDDIKKHQESMKQHRGDTKRMMESQKKAMEANMQYMMKSLKPTLFTLIPILLIFGWLNSHYAYMPLKPGAEFNVTAIFKPGSTGTVEMIAPQGLELRSDKIQTASNENAWKLRAQQAGRYTIEIKHGAEYYTKDVLITTDRQYEPVATAYKDKAIEQIKLSNERTRPFGSFNLFGWYPGWLAAYIIFSIAFSLGLKKAMKLY